MDSTTPKIEKTRDYNKFKMLDANRETNRGHIESLKESFNTIGNLTRTQPILVNEKLEIIDGQHRFVAASELKEEVFYVVQGGLTVNDARQINILHRTWMAEDYARSYAASGLEDYITYLTLREDYPDFGHSIILAAEYSNSHAIFKIFREGDFKIEDLNSLREKLDLLMSLRELVGFMTKYMGAAFLSIIGNPRYDHLRMLRKLKESPDALLRISSVEGNLRQIEELFNTGLHQNNRVRFF